MLLTKQLNIVCYSEKHVEIDAAAVCKAAMLKSLQVKAAMMNVLL
jgi:hypothetical protein